MDLWEKAFQSETRDPAYGRAFVSFRSWTETRRFSFFFFTFFFRKNTIRGNVHAEATTSKRSQESGETRSRERVSRLIRAFTFRSRQS